MQTTTPRNVTLVIILTDGSHRVTSWANQSVKFDDVTRAMRDTAAYLTNGNEVVTAFLTSGIVTQQISGFDVMRRIAA